MIDELGRLQPQNVQIFKSGMRGLRSDSFRVNAKWIV